MPRRFIEPPSVVREDLGDGDFVDIRIGIKWRELIDLYDEADMSKSAKRTGRAMQGLLEVGLAAWGGPGFDQELTPEAIALLRPEDATRLAQLVGTHNPFLMGGGDSDPKGAASGTTDSSKADAAS